jgi:hypothetical protein
VSVPQGTVRFSDLTGLTVIAGTNGGPAVSIRGPLPAINAALRTGNLVYHPPPGFTGTVTADVVADDSGNGWIVNGIWWDEETLPITVRQRPPLLVSIESTPTAFVEQAAPVRVTTRLTPASVNGTLAGATVAVSGGFAGTEDVLTWTPKPGITGSYDATFGILTLTGQAPVSQYQAALRSVRYRNTSRDPSPELRSILFQVTDGSPDGWSNGASRTIRVRPVNTTPVLTVPAVGPGGPPGTDLAIDGIRAADVDARGGVERLTLRVGHGTIRFEGLAGLTVVGGANGSGRLVVEGTLDRLNAALANGNLIYRPAAGFEGSDTLTLTLNDLGLTGAGGAHATAKLVRIRVG